jgi:hypothetical protein
MFNFYTDKFQDFTVSNDITVNEAIIDAVNNGFVTFSLNNHLLNDIITLLEKAILNKLSSDLQFQKNYWTWGFITVYYSNFYLAQILNRLSDKFYIYALKDINKEIIYSKNSGEYIFGQKNGDNTHQREFKLLKANYSIIKTFNDEQLRSVISTAKVPNKDVLFKYTIDNEIKESEIRNKINYQLKHYKEIQLKERHITYYANWYKNILINKKYRSFYPDYFQLLMINEKRFLFLSIFIQELKDSNPGFAIKINKLKSNIESRYNTTFHDANPEIKKLIGDLLQ